ncbi:MAG: glycine zipper 2TM domain-containing protein [Betaproteobacteria bacterium]|nr:MAG: glycine zipper 2TM domain-containing protein [Betaproteobacteria bacterium]
MTKFYLVAIALASALGVAGCGSTGETVGTVGGAAVGGAVGSAATGGSTIGTVGGAAAGGIIGHEVGQRYEERKR